MHLLTPSSVEPSATPTEVVRRESVNANLGGELLDDIPVPDWVTGLLNDWTTAAGIIAGSLFRRVAAPARFGAKL